MCFYMEITDYIKLIQENAKDGKLSKRKFTELTGIPSSRVISLFGSWDNAKTAAGISNKITKDSILADFWEYYSTHNKIPTIRDKGLIPSQPTIVKFFESWNNFIEIAKKLYNIDQCACPYCLKQFSDYNKVNKHCNSCTKNIHEFYIDKTHGPIHYTVLNNKRTEEIRAKYPKLASLFIVAAYFKKYNIEINYSNCYFSRELIISKIQEYVSLYNEIPVSKVELRKPLDNFPTLPTVQRYFASWNEAITAAGFTCNYKMGFGTVSMGLDKHSYRSKVEAYFADTFLYNKYKYVIEPKYLNNIWFYDWYIPELGLYIELDGGIRPWRIEQKQKFNIDNNINCIYIATNKLSNFNNLKEIINESTNN